MVQIRLEAYSTGEEIAHVKPCLSSGASAVSGAKSRDGGGDGDTGSDAKGFEGPTGGSTTDNSSNQKSKNEGSKKSFPSTISSLFKGRGGKAAGGSKSVDDRPQTEERDDNKTAKDEIDKTEGDGELAFIKSSSTISSTSKNKTENYNEVIVSKRRSSLSSSNNKGKNNNSNTPSRGSSFSSSKKQTRLPEQQPEKSNTMHATRPERESSSRASSSKSVTKSTTAASTNNSKSKRKMKTKNPTSSGNSHKSRTSSNDKSHSGEENSEEGVTNTGLVSSIVVMDNKPAKHRVQEVKLHDYATGENVGHVNYETTELLISSTMLTMESCMEEDEAIKDEQASKTEEKQAEENDAEASARSASREKTDTYSHLQEEKKQDSHLQEDEDGIGEEKKNDCGDSAAERYYQNIKEKNSMGSIKPKNSMGSRSSNGNKSKNSKKSHSSGKSGKSGKNRENKETNKSSFLSTIRLIPVGEALVAPPVPDNSPAVDAPIKEQEEALKDVPKIESDKEKKPETKSEHSLNSGEIDEKNIEKPQDPETKTIKEKETDNQSRRSRGSASSGGNDKRMNDAAQSLETKVVNEKDSENQSRRSRNSASSGGSKKNKFAELQDSGTQNKTKDKEIENQSRRSRSSRSSTSTGGKSGGKKKGLFGRAQKTSPVDTEQHASTNTIQPQQEQQESSAKKDEPAMDATEEGIEQTLSLVEQSKQKPQQKQKGSVAKRRKQRTSVTTADEEEDLQSLAVPREVLVFSEDEDDDNGKNSPTTKKGTKKKTPGKNTFIDAAFGDDVEVEDDEDHDHKEDDGDDKTPFMVSYNHNCFGRALQKLAGLERLVNPGIVVHQIVNPGNGNSTTGGKRNLQHNAGGGNILKECHISLSKDRLALFVTPRPIHDSHVLKNASTTPETGEQDVGLLSTQRSQLRALVGASSLHPNSPSVLWKIRKAKNQQQQQFSHNSKNRDQNSSGCYCIDVASWQGWQVGVVGTQALERARSVNRLKGLDDPILDSRANEIVTLWFSSFSLSVLAMSGEEKTENGDTCHHYFQTQNSISFLVGNDQDRQLLLQSLSQIYHTYQAMRNWIPNEALLLRYVWHDLGQSSNDNSGGVSARDFATLLLPRIHFHVPQPEQEFHAFCTRMELHKNIDDEHRNNNSNNVSNDYYTENDSGTTKPRLTYFRKWRKDKNTEKHKQPDITLTFSQVVALLQELKRRSNIASKNDSDDNDDDSIQNKTKKTLLPLAGGTTISDIVWNEVFGSNRHTVTVAEFGKEFLHKIQGMTHLSESDVKEILITLKVLERHWYGQDAELAERDMQRLQAGETGSTQFDKMDRKDKHLELTRPRFELYLMDTMNSAYDPWALQGMTNENNNNGLNRPLSHYWINSSHNTYLTGDQLKSPPSVEMYLLALQRGCKCLELDCWDGETTSEVNKGSDLNNNNSGSSGHIRNLHNKKLSPKNNTSNFTSLYWPVVYNHFHHRTAKPTKILFADILRAVKAYIQYTNPKTYPIILSLENHCSAPFQKAMVKDLKNILGETLYVPPKTIQTTLPSPQELIGKVVIQGKRPPMPLDEEETEYSAQNGTVKNNSAGASMDEDYDQYRQDGNVSTVTPTSSKATVPVNNLPPKVIPELVDLVLFHGTKFHNFERSMLDPASHMHSICETRVSRLLGKQSKRNSNSHTSIVVRNNSKAGSHTSNSKSHTLTDLWRFYNMQHLTQTYPSKRRTDSSNYNPTLAWSAGCQIVSLNMQTPDTGVVLNDGRFRENQQCGYVVKPSPGVLPGHEMNLHLAEEGDNTCITTVGSNTPFLSKIFQAARDGGSTSNSNESIKNHRGEIVQTYTDTIVKKEKVENCCEWEENHDDLSPFLSQVFQSLAPCSMFCGGNNQTFLSLTDGETDRGNSAGETALRSTLHEHHPAGNRTITDSGAGSVGTVAKAETANGGTDVAPVVPSRVLIANRMLQFRKNMTNRVHPMRIRVRVLSGSCLPKPPPISSTGTQEGRVVPNSSAGLVDSYYVTVTLHDVKQGTSCASSSKTAPDNKDRLVYVSASFDTKAVENNGFCPVWKEPGKEMKEMHVLNPQVAMLQFSLRRRQEAPAEQRSQEASTTDISSGAGDSSLSASGGTAMTTSTATTGGNGKKVDDRIAEASIPCNRLRMGYRSVPLFEKASNSRTGTFGFGCLLVELQIMSL